MVSIIKSLSTYRANIAERASVSWHQHGRSLTKSRTEEAVSQWYHHDRPFLITGFYAFNAQLGALYSFDDVINWKHFPRYWLLWKDNSPVTAQMSRTRSFDVFFDLRLNKWLSKQSWGWWFETPSRPLCRHYTSIVPCAYDTQDMKRNSFTSVQALHFWESLLLYDLF